jgi:hypothetical protein
VPNRLSILVPVQAFSGYEEALDPWLDALFSSLEALQQDMPKLLPTLSTPPEACQSLGSQCGKFVVRICPPPSSPRGQAQACNSGYKGAHAPPPDKPCTKKHSEAADGTDDSRLSHGISAGLRRLQPAGLAVDSYDQHVANNFVGQEASQSAARGSDGCAVGSNATAAQPDDVQLFKAACRAGAEFQKLLEAVTGMCANSNKPDAVSSGHQNSCAKREVGEPLRSHDIATSGADCSFPAGTEPADHPAAACSNGANDNAAACPPALQGAAHAMRPAWVPVALTRRETAELHWQQVQHIELDTAAVPNQLQYEPGDLATIWPSVSPDMAKAFLERIGVDPGVLCMLLDLDA